MKIVTFNKKCQSHAWGEFWTEKMGFGHTDKHTNRQEESPLRSGDPSKLENFLPALTHLVLGLVVISLSCALINEPSRNFSGKKK